MKYFEILKLQKIYKKRYSKISENYKIAILSNIIVNQIKEIIEYYLFIEHINPGIVFGDYDNIVQDSLKYKESDLVIIFWEVCNIVDGLHYNIELTNKDQFEKILEKTKSEIDLVLTNLKKNSLVLINKFTPILFSNSNIRKNNLDDLSDILNQYLEDNITSNVRIIDLEKVIAANGVSNSLELRYYYSSKSLYTVDFLKEYAKYIKPIIMSATGKAKKALIFDCDNTLWKGVLGEDGFCNIEMTKSTKDGAIFAEIQSIAVALKNQGVLIGLCTKNNPSDINKVLESHPDILLKPEHITINKSSWLDKASKLKEISQELNLGLDSFVFIDDSPFEVNLIREKLPEITVLQVPKKLYEYPKLLRDNLGLFYNLSNTAEDNKKIEMYKNQIKRETVKKEFNDIEDYLASLGLKVTIFENDDSIVPRMSQMCLKTIQFNLTTKRYTEGAIKKFIKDSNSDVYAFSVTDKFGDSGISGLSIVTKNDSTEMSNIDTFLMSCRVIGRNIEYAFMDYIVEKVKEKKINFLEAKYVKTKKNEQVKDFFERCSFDFIEEEESVRKYKLTLKSYVQSKLEYIELIYGK